MCDGERAPAGARAGSVAGAESPSGGHRMRALADHVGSDHFDRPRRFARRSGPAARVPVRSGRFLLSGDHRVLPGPTSRSVISLSGGEGRESRQQHDERGGRRDRGAYANQLSDAEPAWAELVDEASTVPTFRRGGSRRPSRRATTRRSLAPPRTGPRRGAVWSQPTTGRRRLSPSASSARRRRSAPS